MAKSTAERRLYLNHRFRNTAMPQLGTIYVALAGADLTPDNVTANELTIGVGNYARMAYGTADADWTAPVTSGGREMIANTAQISGGTASAALFGGLAIGFYGIYTLAVGGDLVRNGAFSIPFQVLSGWDIAISPGALQIFEG